MTILLYFGIMDVDQYNHFDADDGHSKTIMDGPSIFQIQKTNKTKCRVVQFDMVVDLIGY
ncbi:hypothetical protein DERP_002868 [Dermatophagoides pteronyssinus]|uniref:Uncharacterized protein n=1 Tax=Dermatophagoides pteronyssinus TaxID=6956 RepID=A0ABQ8JWF3_DERPT|nr:hypothetical protein DERP_002868 [Dermatophagoides pteronyssinus]